MNLAARDESGVPNIYLVPRAADVLSQLTNALEGRRSPKIPIEDGMYLQVESSVVGVAISLRRDISLLGKAEFTNLGETRDFIIAGYDEILRAC